MVIDCIVCDMIMSRISLCMIKYIMSCVYLRSELFLIDVFDYCM